VAVMSLLVIKFGPFDASSGPDLIQLSQLCFYLFFHHFYYILHHFFHF